MSNGQLYTGYSADLKRRLHEHSNGYVRTTSKFLPVQLIFYEAYISKDDAQRRERYFKTTKGKTTLRLMLENTLTNEH